MGDKVEKVTIRLKTNELRKAAIDHNLKTNAEIAETIGVSTSQLWRSMLPIDDIRHNAPGQTLIAGVMGAFDGTFEQFFFLDKNVANVTRGKKII